jgi:hypothetical protein
LKLQLQPQLLNQKQLQKLLWISNNSHPNHNLKRNLNNSQKNYLQVDYKTPAPVITESDTSKGKEVTVSAPNEDPQHPLTDVLAFTKIPEIFNVGQEK